MKMKFALPIVFLAGAISLSLAAFAGTSSKDAPKDAANTAAPAAATAPAVQDENLHLEGEQRYRANCARCHAAPPKFSPRMMATIVRHMRVRAIITDQDMHLILRYMTE